MKTESSVIKVAKNTSQEHENLRSSRKGLRVLQKSATDKENLTGRPVLKDGKMAVYLKCSSLFPYCTHLYIINKRPSTLARRMRSTLATPLVDVLANDQEVKKRKLVHKSVQTDKPTVTEDDLTSNEPSETYWKALAEKRGEALNESLQENQLLKDHIENLKEENRICKEMLDESKSLVEVLQEMLAESEDTEKSEEATEES